MPNTESNRHDPQTNWATPTVFDRCVEPSEHTLISPVERRQRRRLQQVRYDEYTPLTAMLVISFMTREEPMLMRARRQEMSVVVMTAGMGMALWASTYEKST